MKNMNSLDDVTKTIKRPLIKVEEDWSLIGHVAFGLIDRGTNVIQVRPITTCPLCCIFCSVDAGPCSRYRQAEYIVPLDLIIDWFKAIVKFKGIDDIQAHIDTVGDPFTYPYLVDLVQELSSIKEVKVISLETHGPLLNEKIIDELESAGLTRVNLSIDSLDPKLAKVLAGCEWFDIEKVKKMAEYIARNTKLDIIITPVWVPKLNDNEIPKIIEFALKIGAGKKCPPLGIQKYEVHKYGRKPKGVKPMTWREFYSKLKEWERVYNVKLVLRPEDFNIRKVRAIPLAFKLGEKVRVKVIGIGWFKGQLIGLARNRVITIVGVKEYVDDISQLIGNYIKVRIVRVKDNIYVGRMEI